jgi:hypothetical protein
MSEEFLIDHILPSYQVHIIGGPSGIGKTRWTYWWVKDWLQGLPVFGYDSFPVKTAYLATDRNPRSLKATLGSINCEGLIEQHSLLFRRDVSIDSLSKLFPGVKLFIIDPISTFVPGYHLNDYGTVSKFLTHCSIVCERDEITIAGMVHATKIKEGARLVNPRERLLGSAAWGAFAETLFVLGCDHPELPNSLRHFYVLPRNWKEEKYHFNLIDGWPHLAESPEEQNREFTLQFSIPEGQVIARAELLKIASGLGIPSASFSRILDKITHEKTGYLVKVRHGFYLKPKPS